MFVGFSCFFFVLRSLLDYLIFNRRFLLILIRFIFPWFDYYYLSWVLLIFSSNSVLLGWVIFCWFDYYYFSPIFLLWDWCIFYWLDYYYSRIEFSLSYFTSHLSYFSSFFSPFGLIHPLSVQFSWIFRFFRSTACDAIRRSSRWRRPSRRPRKSLPKLQGFPFFIEFADLLKLRYSLTDSINFLPEFWSRKTFAKLLAVRFGRKFHILSFAVKTFADLFRLGCSPNE